MTSKFRSHQIHLGKSSKAHEKLGWKCNTTARELCATMVAADLVKAWRRALLKQRGLDLPVTIAN